MTRDQNVASAADSTAFEWDVFISYSREDDLLADKLERALEKFRAPTGLGLEQRRLTVFRDVGDMTGTDYYAAVDRNLTASRKLIVLCSPAARASAFVDDEITRFASRGHSGEVIPVLVSGRPNNECGTGEEDDAAFPDALISALEMPLAVDYRDFDPKRHKVNSGRFVDAWYTILANVYAVSREEIEQRDQRRIRRLRFMVGSLLVFVIASLTGLSVFAFDQRGDALASAREALDSARVATEQRGVAQAAVLRADREAIAARESAAVAQEQRGLAQSARDRAEREARIAESRELAATAEALFDRSPDLAAALAVEAGRVAVTTQAEMALRRALTSRASNEVEGLGVDISPDGRLLAIGGETGPSIWDQATGERLFRFPGYGSPVVGVAFGPDGTRLATIGLDSTARLWDVKDGTELASFQPQPDRANTIAMSPDGRRLLTARVSYLTRENLMVLWSVEEGEQIATLDGAAFTAVFSPDGGHLLSGGTTGVIVWDAVTGERLEELSTGDRRATAVLFSPGGDMVVAAVDSAVTIWDWASREQKATLVGHSEDVQDLAFSPNGNLLASAGRDEVSVVWDIATAERVAELVGHDSQVSSIAFSADGTQVATSSEDKTAKLWDPLSGDLLATLEGHEEWVYEVRFSPAGGWLVTASLDLTATMWDVGSSQELTTLRGHSGPVRGVAFSPDGDRLATSSDDSTATIWDVSAGHALTTLRGHKGPIFDVQFSPAGGSIATAAGDGTARLWDRESGELLAELDGESGGVAELAFDRSGRRLVTSGASAAHLWETGSGELIAVFDGRPNARRGFSAFRSVALSPDDRTLVTAGSHGALVVDLLGAEALGYAYGAQLLPGHQGFGVQAIAFSPRGGLIATGGRDGQIHLWRLGSREPVVTVPEEVSVSTVSFSPDGSQLATAGANGSANLWEADTGRRLYQLDFHSRDVVAMAFSPDGTRLITASRDHTAGLWEVSTGRLMTVFEGHRGELTSVSFSADGSRVVTGSSDGTAKIWPISFDLVFAKARERVVRELTDQECRIYLRRACRDP